jgi:hypothetical protein
MAGPAVTAADTTIRTRAVVGILLSLPIVIATATLSDVGGALLLASYGIPGLVLAVRRPGQPIAWLLLLMAVGLALGTHRVTSTLDELLAGTVGGIEAFRAWANGIGWVFVFEGLIGIALVFPSGHMPAGRWGGVGRVVVALSLVLGVLIVGGPIINVTLADYTFGVDVPNPYALPFLAGSTAFAGWTVPMWFALISAAGVAGASLVARFLGSSGLERLQYRWLAWALVMVGIGSIAWAVVTSLLRLDVGLLPAVIVAVTYPTVPIAIVVAVLRYRLYEIDRLVSRTLGWGLATSAVVGMFAGAVLALQAGLAHVIGGDVVAVAVSTLLAVAAFQPVRARVQRLVDRRFDRPRLEAERNLAAFGERLQHEVEMSTLVDEIERTAIETLRPAAAQLWIRGA